MEDEVARIDDDFATSADVLGDEAVALLKLTDDIIGIPGHLSDADLDALRLHFSDEVIAEVALGVGLFMGMSKVLIALGLEPESMPTTVVPTPKIPG